jgi:hypothetical protein
MQPPRKIEREKIVTVKSFQKKKRPFVIEYRANPEEVNKGHLFAWCKEWRRYSRYATERDRKKALERLQKSNRSGWEYREKMPRET